MLMRGMSSGCPGSRKDRSERQGRCLTHLAMLRQPGAFRQGAGAVTCADTFPRKDISASLLAPQFPPPISTTRLETLFARFVSVVGLVTETVLLTLPRAPLLELVMPEILPFVSFLLFAEYS